MTPEEAHRLVEEEGYRLLDVRTVDEFEAGRPAGSHNVPLLVVDPATGMRRPNVAFVDEVSERFGVGARLVLTCQSGGRSARAAALLLEAGFTDVVDQRAGWGGERAPGGKLRTPGWKAAGLPTATGEDPDRGY